MVRGWLLRCLESHRTCRQACARVPPLPTRVIEVGEAESTCSRLIMGAGRHDHYATLSHCWGGSQPLTTTEATLLLRELSILDTDLPTTFRDAVAVCRNLNIKYIWIDSLCIVQDSLDDWQKESSHMGEIYSASTLNISAASASDGSVGCFFDRDATSIKPCGVEIFGRPCIISRQASTIDEVFGDLHNDRLFGASPLNSRAWVLQEDVLPCRNLVYAKDQVYWYCHELQASEKQMLGLLGVPQTEMNYLRNLGKLIHGIGVPRDMKKAICYGYWYRSVMDYTLRKMTKGSDKFPAISGLARKFAQVKTGPPDSYVAGLWESDLCIGLLWIAGDPLNGFEHNRRCERYRGPSWSWASTEGHVNYRYVIPSLDMPGEMCVLELLKASKIEVRPCPGHDVFGEIEYASLSFDVEYLMPVRYIGTELESHLFPETRERIESEDAAQLEDLMSVEGVTDEASYGRGKFQFFHADEAHRPLENQLYCLPVAGVDERDESDRSVEVGTIWYLVLEPVEDVTSGESCYRRVGICKSLGSTFPTKLWLTGSITLI